MTEIRIALPVHLRTLARVDGEVRVMVEGTPTISTTLDALEASYPMLRGTIRDHGGGKRRAFIRYFADGADVSHAPADLVLPAAIVEGRDAFCVVGAISGG
jgi:molybdopterin synthase sulfur carrier subunit